MTGDQLKQAGWRQGSIVKEEDVPTLVPEAGLSDESEIVLIAASHSCDIAHYDLDSEPYFEFSIAKVIDEEDGNLTHNKNPRKLHTRISCLSANGELSDVNLELNAFEKTCIRKDCLDDIKPDPNRNLDDEHLPSYVEWLAARYSRPALPSAFNERLNRADPRRKIRAKVKRTGKGLSGIYIQICPDRELAEGERYSVNLLALSPASFNDEEKSVQKVLEIYTEVMRKADMDVATAHLNEDQVSVATLRRYKRLYYEDLTFKDGGPFPPDMKG
ncbi:MAG: hypothetical protein ACRESR_04190 [Gammaproteobacteria bacterium]